MGQPPNPSFSGAAVFDCNVFAQALINPLGPAGACLTLAQRGRFILYISDTIIQEIRELPDKIPARFAVTADRVDALILDLAKYAMLAGSVPDVFAYQRDPDDAHYINLAIATRAMLVVSRDGDLLDLMKESNHEGEELRRAYPELKVIAPPAFLQVLREF